MSCVIPCSGNTRSVLCDAVHITVYRTLNEGNVSQSVLLSCECGQSMATEVDYGLRHTRWQVICVRYMIKSIVDQSKKKNACHGPWIKQKEFGGFSGIPKCTHEKEEEKKVRNVITCNCLALRHRQKRRCSIAKSHHTSIYLWYARLFSQHTKEFSK